MAACSRSFTTLIAEHLEREDALSSCVRDRVAAYVIAQLFALAAASSAPIRLFIHSQGGHVESGDTIHDAVRFIEPVVHAIGSGWVASAGALIFCAAQHEHRVCLPNTRFLLHEPSGGFGGSAADIEIEARQVLAMRARLNAIFAAPPGAAWSSSPGTRSATIG